MLDGKEVRYSDIVAWPSSFVLNANIFQGRNLNFIDLLTTETLEANLCDVQYSCVTIAVQPEPRDMIHIHSQVQQLETVLFRQPGSEIASKLIPGIWHLVGEMEQDEARLALQLRPKRAAIMTTNYWAWRWLDGYCSTQITVAVRTGVDHTCWISRLAGDVKTMVQIRSKFQIFIPKTYGITAPSAHSYTYKTSRPSFLSSEDEVLTAVLVTTTEIIATWLDFPVDTLACQQAWFVHALVKTVGENALLVDEVWTAYTNLRKYVLGTTRRRSDMLSCMETLQKDLQQHPLSIPTSEASIALDGLAEFVEWGCFGNLQYQSLKKSFEYGDAPTPPGNDVEMLPPAHMEQEMPGEDVNSDEEEEEEDEIQPEAPEDLLGVASERILNRFVDFLNEAFALQGHVPHPTKFQTVLMERMDFLYPFRELAPSRIRALQPEGPFTPERARTDEGMFSGLACRGATFGTDFMFQYPIFFHDIQDFRDAKQLATDEHIAETGKTPPKIFFCDDAAFGPSNFRRTIEVVEKYAQSLARFSWAEKFQDRVQVPFLECWDWLRGDTNVKDEKRFPVLGPLASYLLTADLSYTGAVVAPTVDEIATVIWDLNKGAVAGLEELNLIPLRTESEGGTKARADKDNVRRAVKVLFKRLERLLPEEMKTAVGFDVIVLEHSLCKFSRSLIKNWFQIVLGKVYVKRKRGQTPKKEKKKKGGR